MPSPQRIFIEKEATLVMVHRPRIETLSGFEFALLDPPSMQQAWKSEIAFDAAWLGINPILFAALHAELLLHGPGARPHARIFDRDLIGECIGSRAGPALYQMEIFARALIIGLGTEVRDIHDQRVAFPMAAGVAVPLPDIRGQMRAAVHHDV